MCLREILDVVRNQHNSVFWVGADEGHDEAVFELGREMQSHTRRRLFTSMNDNFRGNLDYR